MDQVYIIIILLGPWSLVYEILFKNKKTRHTIIIETHEKHKAILIDNLDQGGIYVVGLVEITDANGCTKALTKSDDVVIEVLSNRPTVTFHNTKPIYILENGRTSLPLHISGRGPFRLNYINDDHPEKVMTSNIYNQNSLEVGEGKYTLVQFEDSICFGMIGSFSTVQGN
jgi:hypothetical protein